MNERYRSGHTASSHSKHMSIGSLMSRRAALLQCVMTAATLCVTSTGCSSPPPPNFPAEAPATVDELKAELVTVIQDLKTRISEHGLLSLRNSGDIYRTRLRQFDVKLLGEKAADGQQILSELEALFAKATSMSSSSLVEKLNEIETKAQAL